VWHADGAIGVERVHVHLGDGLFENSHAGASELVPNTDFYLRVRHSDDSGDPGTQWSDWATRDFTTGTATQVFPLEIDDVAGLPVPRWTVASGGADVVLAPAVTAPRLRLEIRGGGPPARDPGERRRHEHGHESGGARRARLPARPDPGGDAGPHAPRHEPADRRRRLRDARDPAPRGHGPAGGGALLLGVGGRRDLRRLELADRSELRLARADVESALESPAPRFRVATFAGGLQLPVNIAFVPNAGPNADDPFLYVTELYGKIRVVSRDGTVGDYATNLLDFNPTGSFPAPGSRA
jgi:hypothetical protein